MVEYKYSIRDDSKKRTFDTEKALKEATLKKIIDQANEMIVEQNPEEPNICVEGDHKWRGTFVFGVYDCLNCRGRKSVK